MILKDMYSELELNTNIDERTDALPKRVNGSLPFKISLPNDGNVKFNNEEIILTKLETDLLPFDIETSIQICKKYNAGN